MLAEQIQSDLTAAMKSRDQLATSVLRMALAGIKEARVSGDESRELSDDDVLAIIAKEAKRRDEAAQAFADGGRAESAAKELAERDILARYLPAKITDEDLAALVDAALAEGGFSEPSQMGLAMKAAMAKVGGQADGKAVSALVKARLTGG
ncbi:GatB/YqeY domain-containing protein [Aquihabitans sp. G128]|uniref:GatB/YqeY domain-containing protein n=1 Tax=Aquihabitans sp. G128 TaxID=2849779 RepID=UPI001C2335FA|nr:GatB/YqeY domain-containing protein [Aquihabitans sp. G128]QXC59152.1 GatB/YqeY domain-containing protein [Aquihabitans sp. G128]